LHCFIQTASIKISPCAKWNTTGITVVGTGVAGSSPKELNEPIGISIHEPTNSLFIADHRNGRIQMFLLNQLSDNGVTVASNLSLPLHIYIDDDNNEPTIYVSLSVQSRIEKWTKGATNGVQIGDNCQNCVGVAVDKDKNVYITDTSGQRVIKWLFQTNETITVAGKTGQTGSTAELLNIPQGIYVTRSGDAIYVADTGNSRIQKWQKSAQQGITVAGSKNSTEGNDSASLRNPISVLVDELTNVIYIADTFNHRITRWLPDAVNGDVIAGVRGM
jgi:DNA-binding beta-propeller fold protein YncE